MNKKELFKECIKQAIEIGRPYMNKYTTEEEPTQQEWDLALILFKNKLENISLPGKTIHG